MPPDGKLDASGSPLTSSLPLNSATARPSGVGIQERVVLLGGDAGHRLEPVRVVRGAVLDGPVLQRAGDGVGDRRDRAASPCAIDAAQRAEHVLRQPRALDFFVERQRSEFVRRALRVRVAAELRPAIPHSLMPRIASLDDAEPIVDVLSVSCESRHALAPWREALDYAGRACPPQAQTRSTSNIVRHILNNVIHIDDYYAPILGEFEQLVLLALLRLGNGAYGAAHPARNPRARPAARSRSARST